MAAGALKASWLALALLLASLPAAPALAQQPLALNAEAASAAGDIANFFGQVGDKIYDCIFELSEEQLEIQRALIEAYMKHGAPGVVARQLAVKQIRPPKLSPECERLKAQGQVPTSPTGEPSAWKPTIVMALPKITRQPRVPAISLAGKKMLPQWDCAPGVDYVTIQHKGYERKLTGGEICSPFEDVVHPVPESVSSFRLGYTIKTGRLFVVADDPRVSGKTIAWAISGRDVCRNNPDPDCLAAKAIGPLPPGEYAFASDEEQRISWGPRTKRMVAAVYLRKLWHKDKFTPAQIAAILARGNIAIHMRLKGEMSEACLGLEPRGWAYVSSLIASGRATGLNVYIDEPYPQLAEAPPIVRVSSFSLSSLLK
jgi:hypothetical protein